MGSSSNLRALITGLAALCLQLLTAATARATSYTVATSNMAVKIDGKCSLVEALHAVNYQSPYPDEAHPECPAGGNGADVISFSPSLNGVPLIATSPLYITRPLVISGRGIGTTIVRGNLAGGSEVFSIHAAGEPSSGITVTLRDLTIDRRSTQSVPMVSGVYAIGGSNIGSLYVELNRTRIVGHTWSGVYSDGASVTITDSTIEGNSSQDPGGGVALFTSELGYGQLWIAHSTINGNFSSEDGGGIYVTAEGNSHLDDSTVSGNSSGSGVAGIRVEAANGYLQISGSTIAFNQGIGLYSPGDPSRFTCRLSIIAKNDGGVDWFGAVESLTDSLLGQAANSGYLVVSGPSTHNLFSTDPRLDSTLQDLGGNHVKVHALLSGSRAIDYATSTQLNEGDERRLPRGVEGDGRAGRALFDIGAYERQRP